MKLQLLVVLFAVAGSYALPRANEVVEPSHVGNPVENRIGSFVEGMIMKVESAGLDSLEVDRRDFEIKLESLDIVAEGFVENLRFTGASDIRINTLEYSYLFNRLRLDVSLPEVRLSVGDTGLEAIVLGTEIQGQLKGSNIKVEAQGTDYSENVNNLLNERIPDYLEDNKEVINRSLENILSFILIHIWSF